MTSSLTLDVDFEAMKSSASVMAAVGVLGVAALAAVYESCCNLGQTRTERFGHYLNYFVERHAEWCGLVPEPVARTRWMRTLSSEHSLLRLIYPTQWRPLALLPRGAALQTLLALLLVRFATVAVFFSPLVTSISRGLAVLLAIALASCSHFLLRLTIDAVFAWRTHKLSRHPAPLPPTLPRPASLARLRWMRFEPTGRSLMSTPLPRNRSELTEGHLLARAALTHFDATHTLRRILKIWRQSAYLFADARGVLQRCQMVGVLRVWREATELILQREAVNRLREQKLRAWSLMRPQWLDQTCRRIGRHIAPLAQQLEQALKLDTERIANLSQKVHSKLKPSPSERLLIHPQVSGEPGMRVSGEPGMRVLGVPG